MSNNKNDKGNKSNEPVLDFISGNTNTDAAKRLTKNIRSVQGLWLLAKMSGNLKKDIK